MTNFNAVNVTMLAVGILLVYCAVKDKSPKEVIQGAFTSGSSPSSNGSTNTAGSSGTSGHGTAHSPGSPSGSGSAPHPHVTSN